MTAVTDRLGRPLRKLRISVTDRCNLRCAYCMPCEHYEWLRREDILSHEEIIRVARTMADLGVERIRLTGGEPTLRKDLPQLVEGLSRIEGIRSVALTTNGVLMKSMAADLFRAGLQGITISLDSLRRDRFAALAGKDALPFVLAGIDAALAAGFNRIKLNTVVMRGINSGEIPDIAAFARDRGLEPRFIEYMDVGGAVNWRPDLVFSRSAILGMMRERYGEVRQLLNRDGAPADRFELPDGFVFGVISSTTEPFCMRCDRARLTADGVLLPCLYAQRGLDLRRVLRQPGPSEELMETIAAFWNRRADAGAMQRLTAAVRGPLATEEMLARNPLLEMHRRGG
ncbi:MAG: GTP 3',8-cyclase 1 [Myxococcota bacterium]|nr:GTP 3',8-cyclase 1 [Myxococcota bacterium]